MGVGCGISPAKGEEVEEGEFYRQIECICSAAADSDKASIIGVNFISNALTS
jgi:hypothetical protein